MTTVPREVVSRVAPLTVIVTRQIITIVTRRIITMKLHHAWFETRQDHYLFLLQVWHFWKLYYTVVYNPFQFWRTAFACKPRLLVCYVGAAVFSQCGLQGSLQKTLLAVTELGFSSVYCCLWIAFFTELKNLSAIICILSEGFLTEKKNKWIGPHNQLMFI